MNAERDSMTLIEISYSALGVEERSDEAPRAGRARTAPDPEVVAKPKRRQFTAQYRLRILEEGTVKLTGIYSFATRNQVEPTRQISDLGGMPISGTSRKSVNLTVPGASRAEPQNRYAGVASGQAHPSFQARQATARTR